MRGLSPRVRGNPEPRTAHPGRTRSIPACAGEPVARRPPPSYGPGLSPRVRGNHSTLTVCWVRSRSIPACAGEPPCSSRSSKMKRVYPRVCGGTMKRHRFGCTRSGLSPRVRGNQSHSPDAPTPTGSIPACAGEPESGNATRSSFWVYPRVCGGTSPLATSLAPLTGLSPRVRGNLTTSRVSHVGIGSIPACAGEPDAVTEPGEPPEVYPRVCGGTGLCACACVCGGGLSPRVRGNPIARRRSAA